MGMFENVRRSLGTILTNRNEVHGEGRRGTILEKFPVIQFELFNISSTFQKAEEQYIQTILPVLPVGVKSGFIF
jgi:hypothetical protein